jgi:dUTPase/5'-deoxynucleotidase YfbR-like HD superfamily hydrolase
MRDSFNNFCDSFDIVQNALDMRELQRWNGRSLRAKENLSEHTHLVIVCAVKLYDKFIKNLKIDFEKLVKLAALHDSLEIFTGDILSVTKDNIPYLRKTIDNMENNFEDAVLKNTENSVIEKELVKLADVLACYEFMQRELTHPCNDFAYEAFTRSKSIYENTLKEFCNKYGLEEKSDDFECDVRFMKGYENDAGVDIVLEEDLLFLPHKTTTVNLNVTVTPKKGEMAVLCARTSAAVQGLNVAMCPIDADYNGTVTAIVHNISNNVICYKKGQSFCQWVGIKLSVIKNLSNEIKIKRKGKRTNGKLGSTGR